jgi:hypothetical protein
MDKKQERNLTIGIIVLVVLLIAAIAIPIILRMPYTYSYTGVNGITYNITVDRHTGKPIHILSFWVDYYVVNAPNFQKEYKVPFEYGPKELEYIPLDTRIRGLIFNRSKTRVIYITRDINLDEETEGKSLVALYTIMRITDNKMPPAAFKIETHSAVTEESELSKRNDIPVRTCEDSGRHGRIVMWLKRGDENKIYLDGDCIVLEFVSDDDSIAVATKLVYHLIGLM